MSYVIFVSEKSKKAELDEKTRIDLISRQSITIREGKGIGLDDRLYLLIEGSDEAIDLAKKEFSFAEIPENQEEIYRKFKEQEDDAASGMGMIFG